MKKKIVAAMMCGALLVSTLVGCGGGSSNAPSGSTSTSSKSEQTEEPSSSEGGKLVIYSPQFDTDRGPWIEQKIKDDLGIEVEILCAAGADLSQRLIAEKNNPQADIIMGLVQTAMYQLVDEGCLTEYTPAWTEGLPDVYKGKGGFFNSFWQTPIVVAYNPDFVSNPPQNWADLIKPEYNELYSVGNTGSQTVRSYIIGMLWDYYDEATGDISEEGWDLLRDLYGNMRTLPAETDAYALMKTGELPIMLQWFGGVKNKTAQNEIPVEYMKPEKGTPVVAEAIGIVNGCKNPELAKQFVEWWGTPEVMAAYANEFGQAPVHPEAIKLCDDAIRADAEMFKAQDIDWEVAAKKSDEWFEKIELEIMP